MHAGAIRSVWLALASAALLASCGFQLQGRQTLPEELSRIEVRAADRHSDFNRALRRSLSSSGARLVASAGNDAAVVRIVSDRVTQNVLTVDARNIPTDYELIYDVEVQVSSGTEELMATETFTLSRIYSFDETRQLAKEREKDVLREALARDLASVVLRRLASL